MKEAERVDKYLEKMDNGLNTLEFIDFTLLFLMTYGDKWIKQETKKLMGI